MEDVKKQFVRSLLAYCVQRDVAPQELCRLAGIDLGDIMASGSNTINHAQETALWRHASALTRDPLFGLHFGESLQLAALGAVGEIVKSSHTVGEGISVAAALTPLVTDLFTMQVAYSPENFIITFIAHEGVSLPDHFPGRQMADMLMVFAVHELDGLILEKISPLAFTLPFTPPELKEYKRILRCTEFEVSQHYALTFDKKYLDATLLSSNHELQGILMTSVRKSFPALADVTESFQARVRNYVMANCYLGTPTLEDVAANFNMTPRSLQRRLRQKGVSFQDISDSVRKSLALHYLEAGKYPLKEISHILGYNDISAFSRAFKRWTGMPPAYYPQARA